MALALKANVLPRINAILNTNPGAWSATVSGNVGAFPLDAEIVAAVLEADEMVVTKGYFQSVNPTLAQPFMVFSPNISSGEKIPFYYGKHGKVMLSSDNVNFKFGVKQNSADDITSLSAISAYLEPGAFDHVYFIDERGIFLHPSPFGKIELPTYTRTTNLQAMQSEETLIVATAIRLLAKHATPAAFESWTKESLNGIAQLVSDGAYSASAEAR